MKNLILLPLLFLLFTAHSQEIAVKKGTVERDLKISDSLPDTYSLYLPSNFTTEKSWPVIFIFDSEGRSEAAVQLFRQTAERQGYILASPNFTPTLDSIVPNLRSALNLMNHIFGYFPINKNGVYSAGYNEGAQIASALPAVYDNISGIIAVGQSGINPNMLSGKRKYNFVGMTGYNSGDYYEMKDAIDLLNSRGNTARIITYPGGDEWPSPDFIDMATGYFTVQNIKNNQENRNVTLIDSLYKEDIRLADQLRRTRNFYHSYELLEQFEKKYEDFDKKDDLKTRRKELRKDKSFRDQRKDFRHMKGLAAEYLDQYAYYLSMDIPSANFENLAWWSQQMEDLEKLKQSVDPAKVEMVNNIQGYLASQARNTLNAIDFKGIGIDNKVFTGILETIFEKDEPQGYFDVISLTAGDGDYHTALLYAEDLLKTGYKDLDGLYSIPGTTDLKLSKEFNDLVRKYVGEARYYNLGLEDK